MKFVLYTMFGSILMLVRSCGSIESPRPPGTRRSICTDPNDAFEWHAHDVDRTELLLFGAFFLAFAIKVPLFPLHTWLRTRTRRLPRRAPSCSRAFC